ncbi:MAG: hypothetical protein H7X77_10420 [Anaerolineae bacterium]|nr:hypothetical protein [Anaerolineae bacterium]
MRQQKPDSLLKQPFKTSSIEDDDNRIDWSRKTLKKTAPADEVAGDEEVIDADDEIMLLPEAGFRQVKKEKRDKKRQLIMDEESGRIFVKRRRKRHQYDDWSDYYE